MGIKFKILIQRLTSLYMMPTRKFLRMNVSRKSVATNCFSRTYRLLLTGVQQYIKTGKIFLKKRSIF